MKFICKILITLFVIIGISCNNKSELIIKGVNEPFISLEGTWQVLSGSYDSIMKLNQLNVDWYDIKVPGECMMQGFPIKHDEPFTYRKEFLIPGDYKGKVIKLRFEGVYSYARVWVNGEYIRDHSGGFTAWECEITSSVKPGQRATVYVEVTDRADEISYASGYAKHQIGGILRNVSLLAVPENYPETVKIITDLDDQYKNGVLTVTGTLKVSFESRIELELYDAEDRRIDLASANFSVSGNEFRISNNVADPLKWDAEHPNLYRLRMKFREKGLTTWQKDYLIGFREIEVRGNRFLINGSQVKLRGACRHDIHPLLGRLSTPEYDLKDVLLAKEANINFIRTSHYPPDEKFLELCDKYGIYVEDETAVCFVGSHRTAEYFPGSSESSPDFTVRYLSQLKEMVENHFNHPSVIIWSIGNENTFGTNFKKSYDWVKENDSSRPVIFSYPGLVPDSSEAFDIISMHYPGINGSMEQYGVKTKSFGHETMPVIFDEWAHVACYNSETVKEDPNVRDFWGVSLDSMWQKVFETDGGLGGAIWGMIDETFMLPKDLPGYNEWWGKLDKKVIPGEFTGHTIGYGEWGIIDTWRRKKPEFWNVKKAYSPVKVLKTEGYELSEGKTISIPVYNRFDFTNMNEITATIIVNHKPVILPEVDIPPHSKGIIKADIPGWPSGAPAYLDFTDKDGNIIDSYTLTSLTEAGESQPGFPDHKIELVEEEHKFLVRCANNLSIMLDKKTGLFSGYENRSGAKDFSGPYVNLRIRGSEIIYSSHSFVDLCSDWKLEFIRSEVKDNSVVFYAKGVYASNITAEVRNEVFSDGTIETSFRTDNIPEGYLREAGIRYEFADDFDSLSWKRNPYWSRYPEGHLSASEGITPLFTSDNKVYRVDPVKEWQSDKKSFFYEGTVDESSVELVNTARATKENIFEYCLLLKEEGQVIVNGAGKKACRIEKSKTGINMYISSMIDYPDLSWGNFSRNIVIKDTISGYFRMAIR